MQQANREPVTVVTAIEGPHLRRVSRVTHIILRVGAPAYGKECRKCGKLNHFARACYSSASKTVYDIQTDFENCSVHDNFEGQEFFLGAIDSLDTHDNWNVSVLID